MTAFHFVTDQSCLSLFAQELATPLTRACSDSIALDGSFVVSDLAFGEMSHMRKPKKHRATVKTDLSRLIICALGCGLLSFSICGYLDDELGWPLGAVLGVGAAGLGMIGLGIFGKAKSVENVVDGI